jgi:hypothetical protein
MEHLLHFTPFPCRAFSMQHYGNLNGYSNRLALVVVARFIEPVVKNLKNSFYAQELFPNRLQEFVAQQELPFYQCIGFGIGYWLLAVVVQPG